MPKVTTSRVKIGIQVFQVFSPVLFLLDLDSSLPIKFKLTWGPLETFFHPRCAGSSKMELGGRAKKVLRREEQVGSGLFPRGYQEFLGGSCKGGGQSPPGTSE